MCFLYGVIHRGQTTFKDTTLFNYFIGILNKLLLLYTLSIQYLNNRDHEKSKH